jgi:phytoene dehydrogenase-like protein
MEVMPPYKDLDLEDYGLRYVKPEAQVSLLTRDGKALTFYSDVAKSSESIQKFRPVRLGLTPFRLPI